MKKSKQLDPNAEKILIREYRAGNHMVKIFIQNDHRVTTRWASQRNLDGTYDWTYTDSEIHSKILADHIRFLAGLPSLSLYPDEI